MRSRRSSVASSVTSAVVRNATRPPVRITRPIVASFVAVFVVMAGATGARADCLGPASTLQLAFPADGDVDVPTNAKIFVLPGASAVRMDGVSLVALDVPLWDPGPLAPGSTHVVEADIPEVLLGPGTTATWTFTVGTSPAAAPADVNVVVDGFAHPTCFIENDASCSDDFPCHTASLATDAKNVVLWFSPAINTEWMPPTCADAPAFEFCTDDTGRFCGTVTAYGADGTTVVSNEACVDADCSSGACVDVGSAGEGEGEGEGDGEGEGSCRSTTGEPGLLALVVLGVAARRRRVGAQRM